MSEELTKEGVISHKKAAIKKINNMLENFINEPTGKYLKKANLLAYWFESFTNYIICEETYNPCRQIRYNRGNIIKVNFGFNIGKEYGGLHYAVVLDKCNDHNSHVVTVVPLTSGVEADTYKNDVYLGTELFNKLQDKYDRLLEKANAEADEAKKLCIAINSAFSLIDNLLEKESDKDNNDSIQNISIELDQKLCDLEKMQNDAETKLEQTQQDIDNLKKGVSELSKLKTGSIALIGQITTIDKSRIYTPRKSADVLYGISMSTEKMKLINEAIKKQYVF